MRVTQLKSVFHNDLDDIYDFEEVESFFYLCVEYYLNLSRVDLVMNPHLVISNKTLDVFSIVLKALKQQKPIQYVLGHTQFYGLTFKVNEKVLIPRQETEELVALIISKFTKVNSENKDIKILDIGTGSGCIAICLARHIPNAKVFALDVSQEALKIAQENAELNQVDITFVETDILDKASWGLFFEDLDFDVIVSNPPYVRQLEKREISPNVLDYEPAFGLICR